MTSALTLPITKDDPTPPASASRMPDYNFIPRLLAVLHSLPLWIFAALAGAGYAALFAPGFGPFAVGAFRKEWAGWFWLDAITFSIFAVVCAIDLVVKNLNSRSKARHRRLMIQIKNRYYDVYNPLVVELLKIHVTTSSLAAPRMKVRLQDAWEELQYYKKWKIGVCRALKAVFNTKGAAPHGEVDYGGSFPIEYMRQLVRQNLAVCDDALVELVNRSWSNRVENQIGHDELTPDDVQLWDYIHKEHSRLKKVLAR